MDSSGFYDNFVAYQVTSGINDRIFGLYKRVLRSRISSRSNILEIGCGIGSLTSMLRKRIRSGKIEAVDISPKSVAFARNRIPESKISFTASDILHFSPTAPFFDRILLFDVLEHLPEAQLPLLFQKVRSWMNEDSLLLINLPNPAYILFDRANDPAALQETDNPVFLHTLASILNDASLEIDFLRLMESGSGTIINSIP